MEPRLPTFSQRLLPLAKALLLVLVLIHCNNINANQTAPAAPDGAISRGLDFLVTQQNPDGSFGSAQKPALTGLALLDFLSAGHTADVGKYGPAVRASIDWLLGAAQPDGSFGPAERPMFSQAIATLAIAEAYGVEGGEDCRRRMTDALTRSVRLILHAQDMKKPADLAGGWGLTPDAAESNLPTTAWIAMALRAAQDVGIDVPHANVQRAVAFTLGCYDAKQKAFAFQPHQAPAASFTGAAGIILRLLDPRNTVRFRDGRDAYRYLASHPVGLKAPYAYASFYLTTDAAWLAADATWAAVSKTTSNRLLPLQQQDGGWPASDEGPGRMYTTGLALFTLTVAENILPIYQR